MKLLVLLWQAQSTVGDVKQQFCILKNRWINTESLLYVFMLIKYFYLFFTAVSARLKHNLRLLFQ